MATFFKSSRVWVIDFTWRGAPRRWVKAYPDKTDVALQVSAELKRLYANAVRVDAVRLATDEEETQFIRGTLPHNSYCPTGRGA